MGFVLGAIVMGTILALYNRFISTRHLRKAYQQVVDSKQEQIDTLYVIINQRLDNVRVEKKDREFMKRLMKFFKR